MSNKDLLDSIKKLREMTGVGFKDCKLALDETKGDIEKSVELLRKKGIAKASKKMSRTASEGLALVKENNGEISLIEINTETDFVAKNKDFINFCKEVSEINFNTKGKLEKLNITKMSNGIKVEDNLVNLIAKIGEKITIRRSYFLDNSKGLNFFYVHSAIEKNIGKIISMVKLEGISKGKNEELGVKVAMHIAASNPLAIDKDGIDKKIVDNRDYRVNFTGAFPVDIRVSRVTADSADTSLQDSFQWTSFAEIVDDANTYANSAYASVRLDSMQF